MPEVIGEDQAVRGFHLRTELDGEPADGGADRGQLAHLGVQSRRSSSTTSRSTASSAVPTPTRSGVMVGMLVPMARFAVSPDWA